MKRVLLINPPQHGKTSSEVPAFLDRGIGLLPPMGLLYLHSCLRREGCDSVEILDTLIKSMTYNAIAHHAADYDIVGITAHTRNLIDVVKTIKAIKAGNPTCHICIGGPHANIYPEETAGLEGVDSVVCGEGEETFVELVKSLCGAGGLAGIRGIIYRVDSRVIRNAERRPVEDLDSLPFPDRRAIDYEKYYYVLSKKRLSTSIITNRGCPYKCTFCSTPRGPVRLRSPENIVEEIKDCVSLGIEDIFFADDLFNITPDRAISISRAILDNGIKVRWSFRARINTITEELLKVAGKAGCSRIQFGVETGSDEGLRLLKKGIDTQQVREVFRLVRKFDITSVAYFMIGCPHERTRADVFQTIRFAKEIKPDFVLFGILSPYPFTELYRQGIRRGIIKKDYWQDFAENPNEGFTQPFWEEHFSGGELQNLLKMAYKKFYLRPGYIARNLLRTGGFVELRRKIQTGLSILKLRFNSFQ